MPKLPRFSGKEMVSFLEQRGFSVVRIRGSHHVMERKEDRTVVPVHGSRPLKIGTIRGILRDAKIPPKELTEK